MIEKTLWLKNKQTSNNQIIRRLLVFSSVTGVIAHIHAWHTTMVRTANRFLALALVVMVFMDGADSRNRYSAANLFARLGPDANAVFAGKQDKRGKGV